jgi:hypothetical protein
VIAIRDYFSIFRLSVFTIREAEEQKLIAEGIAATIYRSKRIIFRSPDQNIIRSAHILDHPATRSPDDFRSMYFGNRACGPALVKKCGTESKHSEKLRVQTQ